MKSNNLFLLWIVIACVLASACGCGKMSAALEAKTRDRAVCLDIAERFDRVLAGATGACRKNADCGCYNPVSRNAGCGGITDSVAVKRLRELEREFHQSGCGWWVQCGPWACMPICVKGRCVNGR